MKAVMPLEPFSGAVFAYTTYVEAVGPLVILSSTISGNYGEETAISPELVTI